MRARAILLLLIPLLFSPVGRTAPPPASPTQESSAAPKPSPALFRALATGAASLHDYIDSTQGLARIDLVPDQRDGKIPEPTLLCGKLLSDLELAWRGRIKEELERSDEAGNPISCEPAFGGISCTLGANGEWDPAHHFVFWSTTTDRYRLVALIDDDEVMVEEGEVADHHRQASTILAELAKKSCGGGIGSAAAPGESPNHGHGEETPSSEASATPSDPPIQSKVMGPWRIAILPYETSSYVAATRDGDKDTTLQVELGCAQAGEIELIAMPPESGGNSGIVALIPVSHEDCDEEDPDRLTSGVLVLRLVGADGCAVSLESSIDRARKTAITRALRFTCPKKRCDFNLGPCPMARVGRIGNFQQRWPKQYDEMLRQHLLKEELRERAEEQRLLANVPQIGSKCRADMQRWVDTTTAIKAAATEGRPKLVEQLEKKRGLLAKSVCAAADKLRTAIRVYMARDLEDAARALVRTYGDCARACAQ